MKVPEKILKLCDFLDDKKAENIIVFDTTKMANVTNYNIVATATSVTHTKALADYVEVEAEKQKVLTLINREGFNLSEWIILDFGDAFVHIFTKEKRDHYNIEKLLSEGNNNKSFEKIKKELEKVKAEEKKKELKIKEPKAKSEKIKPEKKVKPVKVKKEDKKSKTKEKKVKKG